MLSCYIVCLCVKVLHSAFPFVFRDAIFKERETFREVQRYYIEEITKAVAEQNNYGPHLPEVCKIKKSSKKDGIDRFIFLVSRCSRSHHRHHAKDV